MYMSHPNICLYCLCVCKAINWRTVIEVRASGVRPVGAEPERQKGTQ